MIERPPHFVPVFEHWRKFDTLKVWEIASMMHGIEPRLFGDFIVSEEGEAQDLSDEIRQIHSAVMAGTLVAVSATCGSSIETTHIVVSSLILWLRSHGHGRLADKLDALQEERAAECSLGAPAQSQGISSQPMTRQRSQELQVLDALEKAGFQPKLLPKAAPGKKGVKAEIKQLLGERGEWAKPTVFPKTWERLRQSGQIADQL